MQQQTSTRADSSYLLPGEEIIYRVDQVKECICEIKGCPPREGSLILSNYQLIFVYKNEDVEETNTIPLFSITALESTEMGQTLEFYCKDLHYYRYKFQNESTEQMISKFNSCGVTEESLIDFVKAFKVRHQEEYGESLPDENILEREFTRQGIKKEKTWQISNINKSYELCSNYPDTLVFPSSMTDKEIAEAADYRSERRLPALTWFNPLSKSIICRSSQPFVGFLRYRNDSDIKLLNAIQATNPNHPLHIIDCRPLLSAMANTVKGAGTENPNLYNNCTIDHLGISNIHAMRDSLRGLIPLLKADNHNQYWLSSLEATGWLSHLSVVLSGAHKIATLVDIEKASVLIHCSDGWDRTSQLASLAQLLLDPFYRTVEGFIILIEKDWLAFGHRFMERSGHGQNDFWNNTRTSPIFLQWIECVWQIIQQFPFAFEFTESLLWYLLQKIYSCEYETFLFNSEKERKANLRGEAASCWDFIRSSKIAQTIRNPFYQPDDSVLLPEYNAKNLQFWSGYYVLFCHKHRKPSAHDINQKYKDVVGSYHKLQAQNESLAFSQKILEEQLAQEAERAKTLEEEAKMLQQKLSDVVEEMKRLKSDNQQLKAAHSATSDKIKNAEFIPLKYETEQEKGHHYFVTNLASSQMPPLALTQYVLEDYIPNSSSA